MTTLDTSLEIDKKFSEKLFPIAFKDELRDENATRILTSLLGKGAIAISTVFEIAISETGNLGRQSTVGRDFVDGSDAKACTVRTASYGTKYSAPIKDIHTKRGNLRVMCYERKQDVFYYFVIPHEKYSHIPRTSNIEIPFNLDGSPRRENKCRVNWWDYEVKTFEDVCKPQYNNCIGITYNYSEVSEPAM